MITISICIILHFIILNVVSTTKVADNQIEKDCSCQSSISLNKVESSAHISIPFYFYEGEVFLCSNVHCDIFVTINDGDEDDQLRIQVQSVGPGSLPNYLQLGDNVKLRFKRDQYDLPSTFTFHSSNTTFTIDNTMLSESTEDEWPIQLAVVRNQNSTQCECPLGEMDYILFEMDHNCYHFDCVLSLTGNDPFITIEVNGSMDDSIYIVSNDQQGIVFISPDDVHHYIGTNETVYIWFHRNNIHHTDVSVGVRRGDPECACLKEVISIDPNTFYHQLSPHYDTDLSYCPLMNCTYNFITDDDYGIVYKINDLDLSGPNDYIDAFLGHQSKSFALRYTDTENDEKPVDVGSSHLTIIFITNETISGNGFNITIYAVPKNKYNYLYLTLAILVTLLLISSLFAFYRYGSIFSLSFRWIINENSNSVMIIDPIIDIEDDQVELIYLDQ